MQNTLPVFKPQIVPNHHLRSDSDSSLVWTSRPTRCDAGGPQFLRATLQFHLVNLRQQVHDDDDAVADDDDGLLLVVVATVLVNLEPPTRENRHPTGFLHLVDAAAMRHSAAYSVPC